MYAVMKELFKDSSVNFSLPVEYKPLPSLLCNYLLTHT